MWHIALTLFVGGWIVYEAASAIHMTRYVPQKFGITWPYYEGSCSDFLSYQGAFAVGLDRATISSIQTERIHWFENAGPPRGEDINIFFDNWKATPLPVSTWSEGIPYDLYCAQTDSWFWPRAIIDELKKPGGYYSQSGNRSAYVLPDLGLIVITPNTR